eukprot:INCI9590.3.p1 GENE.INCI9590.3~~INCI9590.3.p1  ORF type:complete len:783 (-),score=103.94 INCI9590.3:340-2688(-)
MSVAAGGASSNAERASERGDPQTADERLREEWDERRKKFHHDRTPPPEVFKDKLFAIIIGTEHCVAVAHEIAYVLEACCGYHHSRVIRLIGDSCTRNNILARLEWCIQSVPTDAKLLIYFGTRLVTPGGVHKREIAAGTTIRTVDNTKTESSDPLASLRSPTSKPTVPFGQLLGEENVEAANARLGRHTEETDTGLEVRGEQYLYCHNNESDGMLSRSALTAALKKVPTREGLLILDGFGAPNDAHSQTSINAFCEHVMNHTYFSVMAPFFRLRNAEDTSMHDEDPRLETAKFRAKRDQVEQRQVDRQNFLIAALSRALVHIAAEPVNSVEGLIEFFQQDVSAVDGECQFSILPSSLTLFPVNVQHMHAVIVSPGLDMVERTESIRTVLMANGGYNREFTHVLSGSEATTPNVSKVLRVIQSTRPEFAAGTAKLLLILLAEVHLQPRSFANGLAASHTDAAGPISVEAIRERVFFVTANHEEHGMLSVREVTSICSVLSKHEAEVTVLVGARYRRRSQVKGFRTLLQTLYDDGECYAAAGFAVAEYTHREYLRRLPKLQPKEFCPPALLHRFQSHAAAVEKHTAVLKLQRLFRQWFLRKRPHLHGSFATHERIRRKQAWVYPTHPSRVFSRFLVEGLGGKARSSLLRDFITINSLFKYVSSSSNSYYKYITPKLWVEHRVPFVFAVTLYRDPLIEQVINDYGGTLQNAGCTLSFGGKRLGPSITHAIEEVLPQAQKIRELILYDNNIGDAGTKVIARALRTNSTIDALNLVRVVILRHVFFV